MTEQSEAGQLSIEALDSTGSTMDAARERIADGRVRLEANTVACACVMAREQTAGRGQRGRTWYAQPGETLCATYMLHCPWLTDPTASRPLGLIVGVAVVSALSRYDFGTRLGLKWPNDVLLNGKKAGGILVERMKGPDGRWIALIGIGLNVSVRAFPPDLAATATSLLLEAVDPAQLPDTDGLARDIGDSLRRWAARSEAEPAGAITAWRRHDATSGRRFEADWNGEKVIGTAEGIDDLGDLLLRLDDGTRIAVRSASSLRDA